MAEEPRDVVAQIKKERSIVAAMRKQLNPYEQHETELTEKGTRYGGLCPVDERMVLMKNSETEDGFVRNQFRWSLVRWDAYLGGNEVLIAAPFGQGRVVLSTMMIPEDPASSFHTTLLVR